VVVGDDGEVLGRVNLVDLADGYAVLGLRVAEKAAGRACRSHSARSI
jgi:ribosomal-protein-alanine N-acetyltransferase